MKAIRHNARKETIEYNIYIYQSDIEYLEWEIKQNEKENKKLKKELDQNRLKVIELKQRIKLIKNEKKNRRNKDRKLGR